MWPLSPFPPLSLYGSESGSVLFFFSSVFKSIFSLRLQRDGLCQARLDQQPDAQTVAVLDHVSIVFCLPGELAALKHTLTTPYLLSAPLFIRAETSVELFMCGMNKQSHYPFPSSFYTNTRSYRKNLTYVTLGTICCSFHVHMCFKQYEFFSIADVCLVNNTMSWKTHIPLGSTFYYIGLFISRQFGN